MGSEMCIRDRLNIGLFNDSFPPTIDGVANTVLNYAENLTKNHCDVLVATPKYPNVTDDYPFEVYRYHSVPIIGPITYRLGNPFSPMMISELKDKKLDLIHVHSPFASSLLASQVTSGRKKNRAPIVFTYHTKYDVDIAKFAPTKHIGRALARFIAHNIKQANEVWTVSDGAGQSLKDIGYHGAYRVMPNGTDFSKGKASEAEIDKISRLIDYRPDMLTFLFVGRMMWYKNLKLILDTLAILKTKGVRFQAVFAGDGNDRPAVEEYAKSLGLKDSTVFTGAIYDRERVRALYSIADLFLFPSTYDTSGLVVKEAAACDCPSLLVEGSCAAEGVEHGISGILAQEHPQDCADRIMEIISVDGALHKIGENAGKYVYLSWEDSVAKAYRRYEEIISEWPYQLPRYFK